MIRCLYCFLTADIFVVFIERKECIFILKGYSTFLEIGSFYNSPRVKQLGFPHFRIHSADFLIFRRISVTSFWSH